jgi:hypothetical protein
MIIRWNIFVTINAVMFLIQLLRFLISNVSFALNVVRFLQGDSYVSEV